MIRPIVRDPIFLARKALSATAGGAPVAADLEQTLSAHREQCVGMAANIIGVNKRIIAYLNDGKIEVMLNPRITECSGEYEASEGCISLDGVRPAKRYRKITVEYDDVRMRKRIRRFTGCTAQIIQHEIDHTNGILI